MKIKGQGALEYLLLIGGAILIAAIVLSIMSGLGGQGQEQTQQAALEAFCTQIGNEGNCNGTDPSGGDGSVYTCTWCKTSSSEVFDACHLTTNCMP